MLTRRDALLLLAALASVPVFARRARASIARALSLTELVSESRYVISGTALQAWCRWETIGREQRIVTYTRVRVDEPLRNRPGEPEVLVRTLGGRVGKIGQIVHGEARIRVGDRALLFLADLGAGTLAVAGMAQGHYPLKTKNGNTLVELSPDLPELIDPKGSAVEVLNGKSVSQARSLVEQAK